MFTTVIGSYPLNYAELGRDTILRAVEDQLAAGIELVSDGQTRYDMIEYFARIIEGYSFDRGKSSIHGKIGRGKAEVLVEDLALAKSVAPHVKGIITGPVTLVFSSEIKDHYRGYRNEEIYLDTARALLDIAGALEKNGAEWIQIDEPYFSVGVPMEIARKAIESIATNLRVPVSLHVCGQITTIFRELLDWRGIRMLSHAFMGDDNAAILDFPELGSSDKMLGLGCVNTKETRIEEVSEIEELIRKGMAHLPAGRLAIHPDCGLRGLPREVALEKMKRMSAAFKRVIQG